MKDFIRDDGKVRECVSNIAKMNTLEWMWYRKWILLRTLRDSSIELLDGMGHILNGLWGLLLIIFLPISYPISAYISIRNAKKEMKLHEKYHSKPL